MKDNTKEKLKQWLGENNQIGMDIWEKRSVNDINIMRPSRHRRFYHH